MWPYPLPGILLTVKILFMRVVSGSSQKGAVVSCCCPHLHCVCIVFRTVGKPDPIFLFFRQPIIGHTILHEGMGTCLEHCRWTRDHRHMDNFSFFVPSEPFLGMVTPTYQFIWWIAALQIYLWLGRSNHTYSWWQFRLRCNLVAHCQTFSFHWRPIAGQELPLKGRILNCRLW